MYWLKYILAVLVMFSLLFCGRVTEKVGEKVNGKIDEKINETMKKIDSGMGNVNLDSLKKVLDSLKTQTDTSGHKAGKKIK
jgi:hypothetical protein